MELFKLSRAEFRSLIHHFSVTYLSIVENCDQAENFIYFKNPDTYLNPFEIITLINLKLGTNRQTWFFKHETSQCLKIHA